MLLIPVRIGPSAIEGNGILALQALPAGTPVWRFHPGFDRAFSPSEFEALPRIAQEHLRHFAWVRGDDGHWILSGDTACFMNHDSVPNTGIPPGTVDTEVTVTLRAIAAGEELTCDYFAFDARAGDKLRATGAHPELAMSVGRLSSGGAEATPAEDSGPAADTTRSRCSAAGIGPNNAS